MVSKGKMFKWFFTDHELYNTIKKADSGDPEAQLLLADRYYYGEGLGLDLKEAFFWYEKAASNGSAKAMCLQGYCLREGIGTEKDEAKAFELFKGSAKEGFPMAEKRTVTVDSRNEKASPFRT